MVNTMWSREIKGMLIVFWGKIEKDISSPILLEASLSYINHSSCLNLFTKIFEPYVTDDKFCADSSLGKSFDERDSGARLTFVHSNSYYLTGVLEENIFDNVKDTIDSVEVFTDIKYHVQQICGLLNKLIVGWGKAEKGISSPILLEAFLLYIDHNSCRNMYINGFEPYVTADKFRAGSSLGGITRVR